MIRSGKLDQPILIQTITVSADGMGASTESFATASGAPLWAQYIPVRGMERLEAGKMESGTEFKLRIRRWAAMTTKHRVVHNSLNCEVLGIEDNHRDGDMVLSCRVRV